tara:strand:+ start:446 stop:688 length:243 start_codon:yes stop_codon:yes gene_type:complete
MLGRYNAIEDIQQEFAVKFSALIREEFKKLEKSPSLMKGELKFDLGDDGLDQMLDGTLNLMFENAMTKKSMDKWVKAQNQ